MPLLTSNVMHKMKHIAVLLLLLAAAGCKQYIKADLEVSIGREISTHEAYYGQPVNVININEGEARKYVNTKTGCIYELDVSNNIVTAYRIISDENLCYLETTFSQK